MNHEKIKSRVPFFVLVAIVFMSATSAVGQKVTTQFDPGGNFSAYRTYAWAKGTPAKNPLINQKIIDSIESHLASKGLQKTENAESADLLVVYHVATDTQTQINTYNSGGWGGYGWGWGGYGGGGISTSSVEKIPVGELIVDFADIKNKKFVWRGKVAGTISDNPQKVEKMLDKSLTKMFKKYPPEPKK